MLRCAQGAPAKGSQDLQRQGEIKAWQSLSLAGIPKSSLMSLVAQEGQHPSDAVPELWGRAWRTRILLQSHKSNNPKGTCCLSAPLSQKSWSNSNFWVYCEGFNIIFCYSLPWVLASWKKILRDVLITPQMNHIELQNVGKVLTRRREGGSGLQAGLAQAPGLVTFDISFQLGRKASHFPLSVCIFEWFPHMCVSVCVCIDMKF